MAFFTNVGENCIWEDEPSFSDSFRVAPIRKIWAWIAAYSTLATPDVLADPASIYFFFFPPVKPKDLVEIHITIAAARTKTGSWRHNFNNVRQGKRLLRGTSNIYTFILPLS